MKNAKKLTTITTTLAVAVMATVGYQPKANALSLFVVGPANSYLRDQAPDSANKDVINYSVGTAALGMLAAGIVLFNPLGLVLVLDNPSSAIEGLSQSIEQQYGAPREEAQNLAVLLVNGYNQEKISGTSVSITQSEIDSAAPTFSKTEGFAKLVQFLSSENTNN